MADPLIPYICTSSKREDIENHVKKYLDAWEAMPEEDRGAFVALLCHTGHIATKTTSTGKNVTVWGQRFAKLLDVSQVPEIQLPERIQFYMIRPKPGE